MRIAVVGAGISGLSAARALGREHEVTLFEREPRLGGHTYTVDVYLHGRCYPVDMGFIVFNRHNYPGFSAMLDELGVPSQPTEMSFSVSDPIERVEYNATRLATLFAQRRNLVRPAFIRMVRDILRFYREAPALLEQDDPDLTLAQYLEQGDYSREFAEWHLMPMAQALWSAPREGIGDFPAGYLVRFMANHRMLQVDERPEWRVVQGGSSRYVEAWQREFTGRLGGRIETGARVRSVVRDAERPRLITARGTYEFDRVVLACHSDRALSLLHAPTATEREVLGAIRYQDNRVDLHADPALLPERRSCWAAWNAMRADHARGVSVTYDMNILQRLGAPQPLAVTLNRTEDISPDKLLHSTRMAHPVFDPAMIRAQRRWEEIDGGGGVHYCGAYWGYGFHEDGHRSGQRVAERILMDARMAA